MKRRPITQTPAQPLTLLLDSGAYSAWSKGADVDLAEYIDYIYAFKGEFWGYVNLDSIPKSSSPMAREVSARESWRNLMIMRRAGLEPMPVFHFGERMYWLERMIGEGFTYIGLGGLVGKTHTVRYTFLDRVFKAVCGGSPYSSIKFHGFGMTTTRTIMRYPWFSVDSTAWVRDSGYGFLLVPRMNGNGEYDFTQPPYKIGVTRGSLPRGEQKPDPRPSIFHRLGKSAPRSVLRGTNNHLEHMGAQHRNYVERYLASIGMTFDEITDRTAVGRANRSKAHCRYYKLSQQRAREHPPKFHNRSSFAGEGWAPANAPHDDFKFFTVVNAAEGDAKFAFGEGMREVLASFYFIKNKPKCPVMLHQWAKESP